MAGSAFGWHLFDLGSTHGSWRNKEQIPAKQFVRLRVGQLARFGGSTRLFLLSVPSLYIIPLTSHVIGE